MMHHVEEATIRRGLIFGFLASLTWGTVYVFGKYGSRYADPTFLAFGRSLVGAVLLAGLALVAQRAKLREAIRKDFLGLAFLGLTGVFGMSALSFAAFRYTSSINVGILMNANPIFTVLLARFVGERLSLDKVVGVLVGLAGCALVAAGGTTEEFVGTRNDILGCVLSLGSGLCWSLYTICGKRIVRDHGGLAATTWAIIAGVLFFLAFMPLTGTPATMKPNVLLVILYLGVVPTAIGFLLWYMALALEEASHLAPLQFTIPLCTVLLGRLFLHERMTYVSIAGMGLVLVGIYVASIRANIKASSRA